MLLFYTVQLNFRLYKLPLKTTPSVKISKKTVSKRLIDIIMLEYAKYL